MKIRPATNYDAHEVARATTFLKLARDSAIAGGTPRLLARIRRALKSADGARRHVEHRIRRTETAQ